MRNRHVAVMDATVQFHFRGKSGKTPSICRKCYVHPAILDSYLDGTMLASLKKRTKAVLNNSISDLQPEEAAVMALLEERLKHEK